jgi:predicted alpha/beta-fold hydrolase
MGDIAMLRRFMLAAALAVGFAGAATAAPATTSDATLPDTVSVAFTKKGGHPGWGHKGGRGKHYGWKRGRHLGWYKQKRKHRR